MGRWLGPDFVKLWLGQSVSDFGSRITSLALPLTALLVLDASGTELGLLRAIPTAAAAACGFAIGVMVDRLPRRPILIGTDVARVILLALIPLAALLGQLRIELLYAVSVLFGICTIAFDVAYMAAVPWLVPSDRLVTANGRLEITRSIADVTGPGVAGALLQVVAAPIALLIDAATYLVSALCVVLIRSREPAPVAPGGQGSFWRDVLAGLSLVWDNRVLRALWHALALHFLFASAITTAFLLYAVKTLSLDPAALGLIFGCAGAGSLLGGLMAAGVARRLGTGPAILLGFLIEGIAVSLIPAAGGPRAVVVTMLSGAYLLFALGISIMSVPQMSLRQALTEARLQGRMNATFRMTNLATSTVGSLAAGLLSEPLGLPTTLVLGAAGLFLPFLRLLNSPVRTLKP